MKILSIDTSSKICSIAILENNNLIKEININNGFTHSETLMPAMQQIFDIQNFKLKDIDLIICDKGPGSFTGIRIGVATAKGFSDSLNINAIGISSLEALAYNVNIEGLICSLIDAKNNNVYWSIFEKTNNKYLLKYEFSADNIETVLKKCATLNFPITFVGDGSIAYKDIILNNFSNVSFSAQNDLSAYKLGLAGFNHFKENISDELLPMYLRKSQAERTFTKK